MKITIFTPTYNRGYSLPRLFESILKQTSKDFEWIIIDDGSTDNTEKLCQSWAAQHQFITFVKKQNGGKFRAVNLGAKLAKGDWFFIVDSDDWLPADAIENIIEEEKNISSQRIGVICGLKCYENGISLNKKVAFNTIECTHYHFKFVLGAVNDLAEVIQTSVIREYPFPDSYPEENFCPEAVIFNRIAKKYLTHYFNKNIYFCEYQSDGLSANSVRIRMKNWKYSMLCYAEQANCPVPFKIKVRSWINFWRFFYCADQKITLHPYKLSPAAFLFRPFGYLFHLKDLKS
ncbi:MAG: glycosyltransferase family 2 protein [Prevotella sp.]|nr:glycosyltransferase family 2 protein [Prevotella sp.]